MFAGGYIVLCSTCVPFSTKYFVVKVFVYFWEHISFQSIFLFLPLSIMFDPHQNSWRKLKRNIKWTRSRVWHWLKTPTTRTYKTYLNLDSNLHWLKTPTARTYKTYLNLDLNLHWLKTSTARTNKFSWEGKKIQILIGIWMYIENTLLKEIIYILKIF